MQKIKRGFSLVEIIIAGTILTVGVFGIYKLFGVNMSLLSNNENYVQAITLDSPFKECLKNLGYDNLSSYSVENNFSINFGEDNMGCFIGGFNEDYSFSGITLSENNYYLYAKVVEKDSEKIGLELTIFNENFGNIYAEDSENRYFRIYK